MEGAGLRFFFVKHNFLLATNWIKMIRISIQKLLENNLIYTVPEN